MAVFKYIERKAEMALKTLTRSPDRLLEVRIHRRAVAQERSGCVRDGQGSAKGARNMDRAIFSPHHAIGVIDFPEVKEDPHTPVTFL